MEIVHVAWTTVGSSIDPFETHGTNGVLTLNEPGGIIYDSWLAPGVTQPNIFADSIEKIDLFLKKSTEWSWIYLDSKDLASRTELQQTNFN